MRAEFKRSGTNDSIEVKFQRELIMHKFLTVTCAQVQVITKQIYHYLYKLLKYNYVQTDKTIS